MKEGMPEKHKLPHSGFIGTYFGTKIQPLQNPTNRIDFTNSSNIQRKFYEHFYRFSKHFHYVPKPLLFLTPLHSSSLHFIHSFME